MPSGQRLAASPCSICPAIAFKPWTNLPRSVDALGVWRRRCLGRADVENHIKELEAQSGIMGLCRKSFWVKLVVRGQAHRDWWGKILRTLTALPNRHAVGLLNARILGSTKEVGAHLHVPDNRCVWELPDGPSLKRNPAQSVPLGWRTCPHLSSRRVSFELPRSMSNGFTSRKTALSGGDDSRCLQALKRSSAEFS